MMLVPQFSEVVAFCVWGKLGFFMGYRWDLCVVGACRCRNTQGRIKEEFFDLFDGLGEHNILRHRFLQLFRKFFLRPQSQSHANTNIFLSGHV